MVKLNRIFPFFHRTREMTVGHGRVYESELGVVTTATSMIKNRVPHPQNMDNYDDWANDPEASIAFNVLTDIIAGVGYYTEMGEGEDENHKNKQTIDEYGEAVNLDEDLQETVMAMLQKGFCPVERMEGYDHDYDLKIMPPETFYMYRDKKGKLLKYTQEETAGRVISTWEKKEEIESIILFKHRPTTSWPYGKSLVEPIGSLLDDRNKMNKDMAKAVHRWGYPLPVISTARSKDTLQKAFEDRNSDEAIFIGNVNEGEFTLNTLAIDPQARFIPYIELIYYQICEGLHAPLLLYLKNATEASATVMMESVDRLVGGIQRYVKRRVERYLFEPQVGKPVPRLVWGQPKTGLEEITLTDVAAVLPYLARNQREDLLMQFGIQLPPAEEDPLAPKFMPQQQPFQKKPEIQVPSEQYLERIADMATSLNIIETNYREHRIPLTKAMQFGGRVIEVHLKRSYGEGTAFEAAREAEFKKWVQRLTGMEVAEGKTYHVRVD